MLQGLRKAHLGLKLACLAVLAVAGQLVLNQAAANLGPSHGQGWTIFTPGYDFWPIWIMDQLQMQGHNIAWYGAGVSNAWPPPHEVLLAPFGLLDSAGARLASILATAALMVFVVSLWSGPPPRPSPQGGGRCGFGSVAWPFLLSAPVFAVIWVDQLQAALGLAALSLAVWAQRREKWWLVGIAAAIGMIRILNAVPVLCILLLGGWGKPRQLAVAAGAAAAFMAPLLFVSYLWDPHFITDYVAGLTAYPYNAAPKVAVLSFGIWGLGLLLIMACAAAMWLVRKDVGRPLDPGRAGLGLGLTVAIAPLGGLYPAIYTLPALIRLGQRPGFAAVPWIVAVAPWLVVLVLTPLLLRTSVGMTLSYVSFIDYGLLVLCYPLLRIPPEERSRPTESPVASSAA